MTEQLALDVGWQPPPADKRTGHWPCPICGTEINACMVADLGGCWHHPEAERVPFRITPRCTNCRCTIRPGTRHDTERRGLCRERQA